MKLRILACLHGHMASYRGRVEPAPVPFYPCGSGARIGQALWTTLSGKAAFVDCPACGGQVQDRRHMGHIGHYFAFASGCDMPLVNGTHMPKGHVTRHRYCSILRGLCILRALGWAVCLACTYRLCDDQSCDVKGPGAKGLCGVTADPRKGAVPRAILRAQGRRCGMGQSTGYAGCIPHPPPRFEDAEK